MTSLWHPFADMSAVDGAELVLVRGEGVFVWDEHGRRYLDGAASLWYANVGHGRREIGEAVAAQLRDLESFHVFGDLANRPALDLAERLASLAPQPGSKVFLTSGGGDAIETAAKLARLVHVVRGEPRRRHLISRTGGYHGTHGIGTSILGLPYKDEFGPLVLETSQVAWDDPGALEAEIEELGPENVAAFVFEPVIGSGGVLPPPAGYLDAVAEICRRHGVLTIADSVIGGFGRLGTWLGVERFGLQPDLILFAKGVTSGYLPLGGVIAAPSVAEPFWTTSGVSFAHGSTYAGHPTCCAAALANLDLLAADGLVTRARELETPFHRALSELSGHELVGEVRGGVGLMAAVALAPDVLERAPDAPRRLWIAARKAGLLTRQIRDGVALAPPLVVEDEHVELAVESLATALAALVRCDDASRCAVQPDHGAEQPMTGEFAVTTATVDEIVVTYSEAAIAHHSATEDGDHRQANRNHHIVASAYRELRRRGRGTVLLSLLEHSNPGVRSWAASHALEFAPAEGERVLEDLSADPGIEGFNARMTLDSWREGNLRFP